MAKKKFKLTTSVALIIAVMVLAVVVLFATQEQMVQSFAIRLGGPTAPIKVAPPADLVVSDIVWQYGRWNNVFAYGITVAVKNQGLTKAEKFEVSLTDITNKFKIGAVNPALDGISCQLTLAPGEANTCFFIYPIANVPGEPFKVQAVADPYKSISAFRLPPRRLGEIKESNERNNRLTSAFMSCSIYYFAGVCGNGVCETHAVGNLCPDKSETVNTCGTDCSAYDRCGDGICNEAEKNAVTCATDCA